MTLKTILAKSLAFTATLLVAGTACAADSYPQRPINLITPTAPGGTVDIVARIMAEKLAPALGQPMIVNNKPGAGGVVGTQALLREPADGYSILFTGNSNQLIVPWVYKDAKFDPIEDFMPIAAVGVVPNVLCVNAEFPAQNLKEFVALVKANPGKYSYASSGSGTLNHLLGEMLKSRGKLELQHVPYRGVAPAMADVLGNQVPIVFASLPSAVENVKSGKLRALAVSSESRDPLLPDVPTLNEEIPGVTGDLWVAFYAAKGTPQAAVDRLYAAIESVLADPDTAARFQKLGVSMLHDGPAELAKRQQAEFQQWKEVVAAANAQAE
ncbi:tripartite tricarboxylate transporter substrate binding protein [Bordetella sp. BOR01]|uniref:Bug family tripartite tricarboxylate transporter substrate binding protein n=1 Tax=Bordetella sp. BOR01 TaxID=2854779 RepID=UPI001C45C246|nr:tripartite tricarboxylate transporter substrate binding protein [Bordetella sp. BOR01]MBV7482616.1 tripartite tricarboxylate transporter substrate binding protein [Bordetella sp. BOR01]